MSALPPKADIGTQSRNVCFGPKADIPQIQVDWRASVATRSREWVKISVDVFAIYYRYVPC
jgi:hypothetical protein